MPTPRLVTRFVRFFYKHFYNRLAFTYDPVSTIVSRGEWRAWTRAGIPFLSGKRILEIAFGTGNLQLDLYAAGLLPLGVDLSPYMADITRYKLMAYRLTPRLVRASVQQLPFPEESIDSVIMTFPPGFVTDPRAMEEMRRILSPDGLLIWVDAPYLYPRDAWSRLLNWAYHWTNAAPARHGQDGARRATVDGVTLPDRTLEEWLPREGWSWRIERVERPQSYIHVIIGQKGATP